MEQAATQQPRLDARLAALFPVLQELQALREYLEVLSEKYESLQSAPGHSINEKNERHLFWQCIKWVDDAIGRITPHMHSRRWPPIWWRLSGLAVDAVARNFHRADAEGYFVEVNPAHPEQTQLMAEREKILNWVDRIDQMYRAALR